MRIGLFGGTFNPVHRCHLTIAAGTRDRLALDRIVFIPTGDPPHKLSGSLAPAHHRLEMVRVAIAGEPTFSVSDLEIRRQAKSYSIDTVGALQRQFGASAELFFLIGLDAFLEFPTWKEASGLLRACHFVVLGRPGSTFTSLLRMPLMPPVTPASLADLDAKRDARIEVPVLGGTALTLMQMPPCPISASEIRQRLKHGQPVSTLLPPPVESYIMRQNLYQGGL